MLDLLSTGKRLDARDLLSYRELKVERSFVDKAEGSALVTLGNTRVLVGVKVECGAPFADTPNSGVLTVNSEFVPLAHEYFEPGPPNENSIELARVVDRGIRESKCIDLEKLVLIPGKKVYVVFVDIYMLNHDGNLMDASGFAALAALTPCKLPRYRVSGADEVSAEEGYDYLPIQDHPVPTTLAKVNGKLLVDPSFEEWEMASVRLTITTTSKGETCAMQKSGMGTLTVDELIEAHRIATERGEENRKRIVSS